jgi:hypothetical protein
LGIKKGGGLETAGFLGIKKGSGLESAAKIRAYLGSGLETAARQLVVFVQRPGDRSPMSN